MLGLVLQITLPLIPQEISIRLNHEIIVSINSIAVVSTCLNLEARDQVMVSLMFHTVSPSILRVISMSWIRVIDEFRNSIAVVSTCLNLQTLVEGLVSPLILQEISM